MRAHRRRIHEEAAKHHSLCRPFNPPSPGCNDLGSKPINQATLLVRGSVGTNGALAISDRGQNAVLSSSARFTPRPLRISVESGFQPIDCRACLQYHGVVYRLETVAVHEGNVAAERSFRLGRDLGGELRASCSLARLVEIPFPSCMNRSNAPALFHRHGGMDPQ